jgi:predicted ATPase/class 3 adenylate cyclase
MPELLRGTVTFLFTDIEGSTRLLHELGDRYGEALKDQRAILREAFTAAGGVEVDTQGDAFFVAFPTPQGAVQAAVRAQRALARHPWRQGGELRVRMGIHTGTPEVTDEGYVGKDVHLGARICAAAWGGQILVSSATANLVSPRLDDVALRPLGSHPLKDIQERIELSQVLAPGLSADFPPPRTPGSHPTNLPSRLPPLIGRDQNLADLTELLETDDVSLVTLTGPGGTGKTRLALATGAQLLSFFDDGVFFVDLSALTDPALVIPALGQALALRESPGRTLTQSLVEHLSSKEMLVILDNFEQVMEAASEVSGLLTQAPGLKVVVTSREALRIQGERVFSLAPLELPSRDHDADEVASSAAVVLFTERARAVRADFALTDDNAAEVAAICRRLDGLPLALELAAARVKLFSPEALLARLDHSLNVLSSGRRDASERQRTLRGAISWSYDLLSQDEQMLLRRLGVFAGGWTLPAAEQVCDRGDLSLEVWDGLASLVDKSLVRAVDGNEERFMMLETIREFALEMLEQSRETEDIRWAHAESFRALAEEADPHLLGPEQGSWLDRLESEHDNLRAALRWTIEEEADIALVIASAVGRFWWVRGHLTEGRRWLEAALSIAGASPTVRAQALRGVCFIARSQGDRPTARRAAEEAREVSESIGDRLGVARAIGALSSVAQEEGDLDGAAAYALQSRDLYEELGDREGIAVTTANLGNIALIQGDYSRAASLAEEGLRIHRENGHKEGIAASELNIGFAALELDQLERANERFTRALELSRDLDHKELEFVALEALAASAAHGGRCDEAARLLSEAEALRQVGGFARERYEQRLYERTRMLVAG